MMKLEETLKKLAEIDHDCKIVLSEGPFIAPVNWRDGMAARLLLWLLDAMPEGATVGDCGDVIDSAGWWHIFLHSTRKEAEEEEYKAHAREE